MTYVKTNQCSSVGIKGWIVIVYKRFSNTVDTTHFNKNKNNVKKKVFSTRNLKSFPRSDKIGVEFIVIKEETIRMKSIE